MTEIQQAPDPTSTDSGAVVVPEQACARGPRGQVGRAVEGGRDVRVRPHPAARERLLDRHAAADRQRQPARRARLLLHAHRPDRPLPADDRQVRLLPDGLGRQRPAHRASGAELLRRPLRPVAALRPRLHAAGEAGPEAADPDQPAELHRALRAARRGGREGLRVALAHARPLGRLGRSTYTTIGSESQTVSQRAFLRNLARGEAYLQEAPTLWDVTFQTAVAQAELEARDYAGHYHRVAFHRPDGDARSTSRPPGPS